VAISKLEEARLAEVSSHFSFEGEFVSAETITAGHINDSFRVSFGISSGMRHYFLQRVNHRIFTNPAALMSNIQRVTTHIAEKSSAPSRAALLLIPTRNGDAFLTHPDGTFWRAYPFLDGAHAGSAVESPHQAYQAAFAFGQFQQALADLPGERLHETIPDFHNTPLRFSAFEKALASDLAGRAHAAQPEIEFALSRRAMSGALLEAQLPERVTHNDTKFNNVLLDDATDEVLCVVDLDTVMPGLASYDFGDLVRTAATTAAEDEADLSRVFIDLAFFEALARGYLAATQGFLTEAERNSLPLAGKLITFEQGLRFLSDHLNGDIYYKIHHSGHNLDRARAQFQLVRSIEQNEERMAAIVVAAHNDLAQQR
jgi:Ser/Thr protein kinase RdoA (MazF antagonist)